MAKNIIFYYAPQTRAESVLWALEEIGEPYELKTLAFSKQEHKSAAFLKINPFGKLPAMVVDGVVITETAAILAYLGDEYPQKKLAPKMGDAHRGAYLRWLFLIPGVMEPAMMDAHRKIEVKDADRTAAGWPPLSEFVNLLKSTLEKNDYITGNDFYLVDVLISSTLHWTMMWGMVEKNDIFNNYVQRCFDRDGKRRAVKISQDILEKQK